MYSKVHLQVVFQIYGSLIKIVLILYKMYANFGNENL